MKDKNNETFDYLNKDYDEDIYICPYQNYKAIVIDLGTRFCRFGLTGGYEYSSDLIPTCIGRPKNDYYYYGGKLRISVYWKRC